MRNQNYRNVFYLYYEIVENGFYSDEEKDRLMKLLASASGFGEDTMHNLADAAHKLENEDISDNIRCQNFLLFAQFSSDMDPLLLCAANALSDYFAENPKAPRFTGRAQWRRAICADPTRLKKAFLQYAVGNLEDAFACFETALRTCEGRLPLYEILCIVSLERERPEDALEFAMRANYRDKQECAAANFWLTRIEDDLKKQLGEVKAKEIALRLGYDRSAPFRIGFSS